MLQRPFRKPFYSLLCLSLPAVTGVMLEAVHHTVRTTAAMVFLLEVLAVAATGDALLAILTSLAAALTFSYDFLPPVGSFAVSAPENVIALIAFLVTAVTGSQLSLRAQWRAMEANRRREEMQRLQRFSSSLLLSNSLATAAATIAREAALEFGFQRIELVILGDPPNRVSQKFAHGIGTGGQETVLELDSEVKAELRLFGHSISSEFQSAIGTVVGLILDRAKGIEDRVRLEGEQRSEELHTTVLNALAHNFRTPLTSIKMASSALLSAALSSAALSSAAPSSAAPSSAAPSSAAPLSAAPLSASGNSNGRLSAEQERDLLFAIDEEADRLQALIRESLEFARLESRRLHPKLELCSVKELLTGVYKKIERYGSRDRFQTSLEEGLPSLRGDRLLFEQMLFQVIDNAWKYSSPSAKIWVSAKVDWSYLILTVQNEGPPVPEGEKERIFERFVRGSIGRTNSEGTGLGLTIARSIAQSFGGKLWLDPEPRGPAFRFALPLDPQGQRIGEKGIA